MSRRIPGLVVLSAVLLSAHPQSAEPTAFELATALQKKYSAVRDFSADFTSEYQTVLKKRLTERGKVLVKKPGRMRWEYKTPEEKLFVADGVNLWSYIRQDRQAFVTPLPDDGKATTPILFLAGKGDMVRDFTPSNVDPPPGTPAGLRTLRLTPKTRQPEYDWLTVTFDPVTLSLRGLSALDAQGGVLSFQFTNWKENIGIPEKQFVFKAPEGTEVVTDATRR